MKLTKRIVFGLLALSLSGAALAQTTLPPFITGTQDQGKDSIDYIGIQRIAANTALTATASGSITTSQVLNKGYSHFTTVTSSGDAARLPTLTGSVMIIVTNNAASNAMNIFPDVSASTINAIAAGSAFSLTAGKTAIFIQSTQGKWHTIPLVP
jgi:hypothetical protein